MKAVDGVKKQTASHSWRTFITEYAVRGQHRDEGEQRKRQ